MSAIRSVVVAGSGPVAWISAAGLLRAFAQRKLDVCVVNTGGSRGQGVGRWTLPSQRGMHALLGIAEPHFVQHTGATYKLASEHLGWQGEQVALDVEDEGGEFDPRQVPDPPRPTSVQDARIGGWGIPIVRHFSDGVRYRHEDGRNCLTLLFRASPPH